MVDDGRRVLVERLQTRLDRLLVVVDTAARLGAVQQSLHHRVVGHVEVDGSAARHDLQHQ